MGPIRREDDIGTDTFTRGTPPGRDHKDTRQMAAQTLRGVSDLEEDSRGQTELRPESREAILPDGRDG